jgi:hypothetical protein
MATAEATAEVVEPTKPQLVDYPGISNGDLLEVWPEDHKAGTHKPLAKKNFRYQSVWYEHMAVEYSRKAEDYTQKATDLKEVEKLGGDPKEIIKLRRMQEQLAALTQSLAAQGIDVSKLSV